MAQRKLQSEIDRTLKKVAEGVELFESIYEKMQASTNQTQKEKQEIDLKTQIKKLQRLRDQIKTWVASNDIKDKSALLDNRKLIETQMERFKACEKEMKTKAFSKEGLTAALKLDPKAQEKNEAIAWLQSMVDELGMQLEAAEAEVETLQGGQKKKGKGAAANERLDELEHMNERRKWHIGRLELILRLLENGTLATEKATQLKEDVSYFVESNAEEGFEEDEGIYDELNLDEEELRFKVGLAADEGQSEEESIDASEDLPPRTPAKEPPKKASNHDDDVSHKKEEVASPVLKRSGVALRKQSIAEATKPPIPTANFSQQPMASILKQNLPAAPRAAPPTLTPIRYSAAVTAASAPQTTASSSHPAPTPALPSTASVAASNSSSSQATGPQAPAANDSPHSQEQAGTLPSPSLTHPSISAASPMLSVSTSAHPAPSHVSRMTPPPSSVGFLSSRDGSPALSEAIPAATSSPIRLQPAGGILASENPDISQASLTLSPPSGSHASLQTLGPNSTLQAQGQSSHALSPRPPQPQNSDVPSLPTQPQEPA
ncbi:Not3-domain-containing protein, partial [Sistotremastrum suecicum HHB10207 ss-3]